MVRPTGDPDLGYATHTESSRTAVKAELIENVEWDDPFAFAHLRMYEVEEDFVEAANILFSQDDELQSAKTELMRITADSSKQETVMYPHLSRIFEFIELLEDKYGNTAGSPHKSLAGQTWLVRSQSPYFDRPQSDRNTTPKEIVVHTANFARLHMSGRPFQLFSVGLLIYGNEFCVGIYDRAGVRFSPSYHI
ncbi:hypothetical protein CERSUDRAFT_98372 [Gelatoporia subvermispora B]|uniref:Fungal-type protein kinase domain-containing protein n=1 Tax=Ceriporiopsis subvermispora (strain B) TaxID=914234 RepID=M2R4J0_CERS8|nr:hypothetical protein CERSUDRAFT_98372 [Gelatoporia subvermispora B]